MVDAVARQRYAGECVKATSETGEAMVTRFDGDSDHGGADLVDNGVLATAVGKTTKQE